MKPAIEDTRRRLGELAAMAQQSEDMERQILERAERRLEEVDSGLNDVRPMDEPDRYQQLIAERGQLHQVIAQATEALETAQ